MKQPVMILAVMMLTLTSSDARADRFPVSSGQLLEIDLGTGGSIDITGESRGDVDVEGARSVRAEKTSKGVRVTAASDDDSSVKVVVRVPSRFNVTFRTGGGSVKIDGVEGTIQGRTAGGNLNLSRLRGELDLTTMGGNVSLIDSDVDGKVKTMGGRLLFRDVRGDVNGQSMGGNVIHENVTRRDGTSTGKAVVISTMGGTITVKEALNGAELHTMGGNIEVGSVRDHLNAKTMGGDIEITDAAGSVIAQTMGGDIRATITSDSPKGKGDIVLDSKGGRIRLLVPADFSMDLEIDLYYTKSSSRDYEIRSDFPVATEESESWIYSHGDPRRLIKGRFQSKGAKHKVRIETINGNVDVVVKK